MISEVELPVKRAGTGPSELLRPGTAFLTIVALACLTLEMELLQQIAGLRLYLTIREIGIEAAIALLLLLLVAAFWWLLVLIVGHSIGTLLPKDSLRSRLCWSFWISAPLACFLLYLLQSLKLEILPQWHAGTTVQLLSALILSTICLLLFWAIDLRVLHEFCRTRMTPIGWLHLGVAVVAAVFVWFHGVRLFHDYEHPSNQTATDHPPDIYLITIDTVRADGMSLYGYKRETTPYLDKFAQRSFTFDSNFANSNFTTPSITSIETGKLPWSHRVYHAGGFLRGKNIEENLVAKLKERGYYTAMISSNLLAAPFRHRTLESYSAVEYAAPIGFAGLRLRALNLLNCNAQFTVNYSLTRFVTAGSMLLERIIWGDRYPSPPEDVFDRAKELLAQQGDPRPLFLWTHILPPHDPYWVPAAYQGNFVSKGVRNYDRFGLSDAKKMLSGVTVQQLRSAYDEMMLYADHSVGEYLAWLQQTGRLDNSIVIISSDHGEMFDHGDLGHGGSDLYNGLIRVPLLIHLPGQTKAVRVEQASQQADLLSTVLDLIWAPTPEWTDGRSLRPLLENRSLDERYIFSMNLEPNSIFDPITKGTVAVIDSQYKFVRYLDSGREQLYRYRSDAGEEHDLIQSEPAVAEQMREVLLAKIEEVNRRADAVP